MAERRLLGVESILMGDIAVDGGMGTTLTALGVTYRDSAELLSEEVKATEHYSEENDDPEEIVLDKGITTVKWAIIDASPDTLIRVLGGTKTGTAPDEIWHAPATAEDIEQSVQINDKKGYSIDIVRAKITASIDYKVSRSGILKINITAKVLTPTKAATAPYTIG